MEVTHEMNNLDFLSGGGELGTLMREKDWQKTSLGAPEKWPQSLRTTLSILLHSGFPMVLFWGPDLICFYNDAFRPSLGKEGKHPAMLGMKGEEAWSEIWTTIKPWIDDVMNESKAIWNEDLLVPIYRNGKIEDVYWTFSYSPVNDESGKPAGVFVAVVETTGKINTLKELGESEKRFRAMADNIPNLAWMANADGWIYWYNKKWYSYTGTTPQQMEGWGWQMVHDPKKLPIVMERWQQSISSGKPFEMVFPLRGADGNYRQFLTRILPVRDEEDKVTQWFGTNTDITQQIETEQALKESEERFRTMAEASDILIAMSDETSNATYFNKAWVELTGRPMEDLLKFGWADLVHPDDREWFIKIYLEAFENRRSFTGEFRVLNKNGEYCWLLAQGPPLFRPDGSFAGYISSCLDITTQKEALKKIEESEQDLRSMVLQSPVGICVLDAPTRVSEIVNESFIEIAGKPYEAIAGKFYWEAFAEAKDYFEQALTDVVEKGVTYFANEVRLMIIRHGKEEIVYVTFVYAPIKDTEGRVKKVAVWLLENTKQVMERLKVEELVEERTKELKQLNDVLQKSEERYHLMIEEVQDYAILYLNSDGTVENWNLGAEKIKGYKADEIIGKHFSIFYREEDKKNNMPQIMLEKARKTGKAVQEAWRVRKDGSSFWASVVITAIHNNERKVIGFSKVTHDLTEKKNAEDQLKINAAILEQKNWELEKMNKELQSFAYISSHDLQEPLRKIQTFASQIMEKEHTHLTDSGKDKFHRMQNAAERMQTLIDDLLAYSRTGNTERKFEKTDIGNIIQEVKEDLKEELQNKHVVIEIIGSSEVSIIPFQFRQLLFNLISNSIKFSDDKRAPYIKIINEIIPAGKLNHGKSVNDKSYFHMSISDNGIGFEQEFSEKIFEVFQRLHGKQKYNGTGIGLAIVKKIVENHHGIITAKGELNKGATFDIYIPVV